jgi:hypothetical protein
MSSIRWRSRVGVALSAALAISLIAAVPAIADDTTASVRGVITDAGSDDPVAGAQVTVSWFDGQGTTIVTTDANGAYEVTGIPTSPAFEFEPGTELTGEILPPDDAALRIGFFPAQQPLAPGEQRTIDVALRPFPSTWIESSPVCLGDTFTVGGLNWDAGDYRVRATSGDGVSLVAPDSTDFSVAADGEFAVTLDTRDDAPVGDYQVAIARAGTENWMPLDSGIQSRQCSFASSTPTIVGTAAVGETLTIDPGDWDPSVAVSLEWFANGVHLGDADGNALELTSAQAGKNITASLTGEKDGFASVTRTSEPTAKVITRGAPKITGSAITGSTLTATPGTWTTGSTFTYQWRADGQDIAGATKPTFVPSADQDGTQLSVTVTGGKTDFATASATSGDTARVMRWSTPKVSGYAAYGGTLTAVPGDWSDGTTFTYQWYASGAAISGATKSTLKLGTGQKAKTISVKVTGKNTGRATVVKTSAATGKTATTATPTISGSAVYGSTLTAKAGTWTSGTSFAYQWYADGTAISGATKSTLKLGTAQKDAAITVKVTGRKSGYGTVPKTSRATLRVMTPATPAITGTAIINSTLTAKTGTWTSGAALSVQWYANGSKLSGKTSSTLKITESLAGKRLTVQVTGKKSGYTTVTKTSAATASVGYPSRTAPTSSGSCPSWAPIKGNADSGIYHVPGGRYYNATKAEECFRTESAAVGAGYRKSKA